MAGNGTGSRHYGMDWLRIGAFVLLILYHIGLVFSPWPYELKSALTADWVALPLLAMNAWRLSLLFAISGYASAAMLARDHKGSGHFVRERLARLGLPLLFGMAVIVTPQPWVALVMQHGYEHGFGWFLLHDYYRPQDIDGIKMPSWMHLWFVVYLLVYTLITGALLKLPDRARERISRAAERVLVGWLLLPLPIAYVFAARLLPHGWSDSHDLIYDPAAHLTYFAMFLFGWLLRRSDALAAAIARQWPIAAAVALIGLAGVLMAEWNYPGDTPLPGEFRPPFLIARAMQMWGTIVALFGIAARFWNRDHPLRATLAEAVFPFYIIHQTAILVIGYWIAPLGLSMIAEFAVLVAGTALACWLFYMLGREIGPLRMFIGLKRRAGQSGPTATAREGEWERT